MQIYSTFRDGSYWVVIRKNNPDHLIGYVKGADGTLQKVTINPIGTEMLRRLKLMIDDGVSIDEIQEMEGELPEAVIQYLEDYQKEVKS